MVLTLAFSLLVVVLDKLFAGKALTCLPLNFCFYSFTRQKKNLFSSLSCQSDQICKAKLILFSSSSCLLRLECLSHSAWKTSPLGHPPHRRPEVILCQYQQEPKTGLGDNIVWRKYWRNGEKEQGELCSVLCNNLIGRRIWKRIDTCICITESLSCTPETNTTLLINYTPYKIKS